MAQPLRRVADSGIDPGVDGAMQLSAVWAVVELLVDNIASLPLFVYTRAKGEAGHKKLARKEFLWRLLHDEPNRRMTAMEFFQFLLLNFILRGNAFARLIRDGAGEVIEMWPLASDQMRVEVLRDRSVVYTYTYDGVEVVYAADSILHWKDKGNGIVGMDRLAYMRSTLGLALNAQTHSTSVFTKRAKRPGIFMIDKLLSPKQRTEIRSNYAGLVEGSDDDLLVLEAGAKFQPLDMTPADLQLLDTRRFSIEEIARWFGVPSVLINDTAKTTTWGTGVGQLIEGFYKFRLRPILSSLEQAIEFRVLTPDQRKKLTVEFSLDALLRGSLKDRLETGAKAVQNGLMTRNEWRQLENLPPMPGGDILTAQTNLTPLEKLGETPEPPAAPVDPNAPTDPNALVDGTEPAKPDGGDPNAAQDPVSQ